MNHYFDKTVSLNLKRHSLKAFIIVKRITTFWEMDIFCRSKTLKGKGESGATEDLVATNFPSRDFPQTLSNLASQSWI